MRILAGDIGGTNSRLIVAEFIDNNYRIQAEMSYASVDFAEFTEVLSTFIKHYQIECPLDAACLAVAGPVIEQKVKVTNLPWVIEQAQIEAILQTRHVKLVNDFTAVAHGVTMLGKDDFVTLQSGSSTAANSDAVIVGAGTGLGAIHLVRRDDLFLALPSEAGHVGFAPADELQCELLAWMQQKGGYVSLESLLSGGGIYRIYQFLKDVKHYKESPGQAHSLSHVDPAQLITQKALAKQDALCVKTLDCFVDIYASAVADIALHYYPLSEVIIAGGIAPKIREKLESQHFLEAFRRKGLMSDNLQALELKLVLQEKAGLYGAMSLAVS